MDLKPLPQEVQHYIRNIMPRMNGWCTPEKAESLARCVLDNKPRVAVEVGVYAGRSLIAIAQAMKCNRFGRIIGIDPWQPEASVRGFESDPANRDWWSKLDHNAIYKECKDHINLLSLGAYVELFEGTSTKAASLLGAFPAPYLGLLHIDGNHSEHQALMDVELYVPMVEPGGYVFFDDLDWQTTKSAQRRLADLCEPLPAVGTCGIFLRR